MGKLFNFLTEKFGILRPMRLLVELLDRRYFVRFMITLALSVFVTFLELLGISVIAVFVGAVSNSLFLQTNPYVNKILDYLGLDISSYTHMECLSLLGLVLLVIYLLRICSRAFFEWYMYTFCHGVDARFGAILLSYVLHLDYQELRTTLDTGMVFTYSRWNTFFGSAYLRPFISILNSVLMAAVLLGSLFIAYPVIAIPVFIICLIIGCTIFRITSRRFDRATRLTRDIEHSLNKSMAVVVPGFREIKLNNAEDAILKECSEKYNSQIRAKTRQILCHRLPTFLMEAAGMMGIVLITLSLAYSIQEPANSASAAAIFAVASLRIVSSMAAILGEIPTMRIALPYLQELKENFFSIPMVSPNNPNDMNPVPFTTQLSLCDVSFRYPGSTRDAVNKVNFSISARTSLGIIGFSGSGKSTLIDVISGLFEPSSGTIIADQCAITQTNRRAWMKHVSYVTQSPWFFPGTIAENIAYSIGNNNLDINEEKIGSVCKKAGVSFLDPELGIHTRLKEGGEGVSGGERQRLAIARALYRDADLIILDEPTSAVDIYNERKFTEMVNSMKNQCTMIIVAHRLDTVKQCDSILWLHNGEVKAIDKPEVIIPQYEQASREQYEKSISHDQ